MPVFIVQIGEGDAINYRFTILFDINNILFLENSELKVEQMYSKISGNGRENTPYKDKVI